MKNLYFFPAKISFEILIFFSFREIVLLMIFRWKNNLLPDVKVSVAPDLVWESYGTLKIKCLHSYGVKKIRNVPEIFDFWENKNIENFSLKKIILFFIIVMTFWAHVIKMGRVQKKWGRKTKVEPSELNFWSKGGVDRWPKVSSTIGFWLWDYGAAILDPKNCDFFESQNLFRLTNVVRTFWRKD